VKQGGKVFTKKLSSRKYQHICVIGDKRYKGPIKTKKKGKRK